MFVSKGAKSKLIEKRKESFYENFVVKLIEEAKKINISVDDIVDMIQRGE